MATRKDDAVDRQRRLWDKQAPRYDREMRFWERVLFGDAREWVCGRASGEVLEVAVGTGRNLRFYPDGVRLAGIDLSPAMLAIARDRADRLGREIELREGDAHALPYPDASFDTVVCTFSLCNIPDERRALAEMHRILRPAAAGRSRRQHQPYCACAATAVREAHPAPVRRSSDPPPAAAGRRGRLHPGRPAAVQAGHVERLVARKPAS